MRPDSPMRPLLLAALAGCAARPPAEPEDHALLERCLRQSYPQSRADFPALLNCLGLVREAVEVGVQAGVHARGFLDGWAGQRVRLVDTWGSQDERMGAARLFYVDIANVHTTEVRRQHRLHCEARLQDALSSGRAEIVDMDSTLAASTVADGELDFVYLDARHDFAGVVADIRAWWPKVKPYGVFAGHDYVDGEFPEGDFFWKSALREALPGVDGHVRITLETNTYPSFFVVKVPDLAVLEARALEVGALTRRLYAERSAYFSLWRAARPASGAGHEEGSFLDACRDTCGGDCAERAGRFTPTRTAGSTLRPFACTAAAEEGTASAADTCASEQVVDVDEYRSICVERCNVTCQQRRDLFSAYGDEILAS